MESQISISVHQNNLAHFAAMVYMAQVDGLKGQGDFTIERFHDQNGHTTP